jgi:hypothetical protein
MKIKCQLSYVLILLFTNFHLISTGKKFTFGSYQEEYSKILIKFPYFLKCNSRLSTPPYFNNYQFYSFYSSMKSKKYEYKIMTHYNDYEKLIVFSFSAPWIVDNYGYFLNKLYKRQNQIQITNTQLLISSELYFVYNNKIRPYLIQKIISLNNSNRENYSYIMTGHSFGGTLAQLAGYELTVNQIITQKLEIYSFASLNLGNLSSSMIEKVNNLKIYKFLKIDDLKIILITII